jgi:hypothetical protein
MSSFVNGRLTIWMQILGTYTFRPSRIRVKGAKIKILGRGHHQIRDGGLEAVRHEGIFCPYN